MRASKVGQDIVQQVNGYTRPGREGSARAGQGAAAAKARQLQQQAAILAPDVKAARSRRSRQAGRRFRPQAQKKQSLIQGGFIKARQQVEQALGPILQGIMKERGANLLLDRNAVVLGTVDVDITGVAVQRLNQKMPT